MRTCGTPRPVNRENIYNDVIEMYQENIVDVLEEFPFQIQYEKERAVDTGGVCRDVFSPFCEEAYMYLKHFDGEKLLVPAIQRYGNISYSWYYICTWLHGVRLSPSPNSIPSTCHGPLWSRCETP